MLENKWNNIAPEVPQDFHNKFEDTLKQIEQADSADKKYKRKRINLYSEYRPVCNTKWCDGYPDRFYSGSGIPVCFF